MKLENPFEKKNKKKSENIARIFAATLAAASPNAMAAGSMSETTEPTITEQIFNPENKEIVVTSEGKEAITKISKKEFVRIKDVLGREVIEDSLENQRRFLECADILEDYIAFRLADKNYHLNPAKELQDIVIKGMGIHWEDFNLQTDVIMYLEKRLKQMKESEQHAH